MTRARLSRDGETPFGAWLRAHPALESHTTSLAVTDADWIFHKYRLHRDSLGRRDVQLMMFLEVKCFGAVPSASQEDTLYMLHQCMHELGRQVRNLGNRQPVTLWHFGVFVLSLPGAAPQDQAAYRWGAFGPAGRLEWRTGTAAQLAQLLAFERRPDTFQPLDLRRHHASREVWITEQTPLGFAVDRPLRVCS
jgi:hypothetical protein